MKEAREVRAFATGSMRKMLRKEVGSCRVEPGLGSQAIMCISQREGKTPRSQMVLKRSAIGSQVRFLLSLQTPPGIDQSGPERPKGMRERRDLAIVFEV